MGAKCEYFVFLGRMCGKGLRVWDGRSILQSYQCPNNFFKNNKRYLSSESVLFLNQNHFVKDTSPLSGPVCLWRFLGQRRLQTLRDARAEATWGSDAVPASSLLPPPSCAFLHVCRICTSM